MSGWRPALRIAWRDALRHKGRSILVLVMISLPVLAVSAAAVVIKTADLSGAEGIDRTLGAADARVRSEGRGAIVQAPDPRDGRWSQVGEFDYEDPLTEAELGAVLGTDTRFVPITTSWVRARLGDRVIDVQSTGVDLSDPLARGLFELEAGRLPEARGEIVVNDAMLDKGWAIGDELTVSGTTLTIVGSGRDATARTAPVAIGSAEDLTSEAANVREWLVETGAVPWRSVLDANRLGAVVTSRAVLEDPPDIAATAEQMGDDSGRNQMIAVVALIVVMALIEVVLLAGPAFAVGARRHARTLALIAASGGTPAQSRRVILGGGVVLGLVASVVGLVLGITVGWAVLPLLQRFDGEWFGPLELPWRYLAAIVAFGLVSALLASIVPAWLASRQDVVAVLAGRRGDRRPRASTPVLGLVFLGLGIAASTYGALASDTSSGAFWIAGAAIVSVLGMIMVVPVVVSTVARVSSRLPLTSRYAARDAARHRTRTVPAVAAVAATVAGVVALGIASASDERQNEETYTPQAAFGTGYVSWSPDLLPGEAPPDPTQTWSRIEETVRSTVPDVGVRALRGLEPVYDPNGYTATYVDPPRELQSDVYGLMTYGPTVAVEDDARALGIDGETAAVVDRALADGRAVLFTTVADTAADVSLRQEVWGENDDDGPDIERVGGIAAQLVPWDQSRGAAPAQAVLPTALAERLDLDPSIVRLRLSGDLSATTETRIKEAVQGAVDGTYVYVERGYQRPDEALIILLVLGALGGVLMLGGTLTATFLALSDARPDLATLSAVGAAPRTRRRVAASYALVIGFVGAILGAAVGFIPGIAISRPLTSAGYVVGGAEAAGPFLAIPWLLIATIVVALPLLTAAVVGLSARSRLPLVAQLD